MRRHVRKRKCKNCKHYFQPDHRSGIRQKFCTKPACRKASKADSQRRWLQKPHNQDYFKGPVHVARVRRWRECHPGYWRKTPDEETALQDSLSVKSVENRTVTEHLAKDALQDVLSAQPLVLLGLIAQLTGSALQDDIAATTRRLRQLGDDILNHQFSQKGGRSYGLKASLMPGADPKAPGGV